jgi:hypothetical protein
VKTQTPAKNTQTTDPNRIQERNPKPNQMPERLASPTFQTPRRRKAIATSWYHQFTNA